MSILLNITITTAVAATTTAPVQTLSGGSPESVLIQATFNYGSGGTTIDAYVQTSADGGTTWADVVHFSYTTAAVARPTIYNLSSLTPLSVAGGYQTTDGTLAANTAKDGIVGSIWRVKYVTTGTYAGGTTLRIDIATQGLLNT